MKKNILFTLLVLFVVIRVFAQPRGDVEIVCTSMKELGDSLHVELELKIKSQAIAKVQSWALTPLLSTDDGLHKHVFPRVRLNGNHMRKLDNRLNKLNHVDWSKQSYYLVVNIHSETDTTFKYRVSAPYQEWMDQATLQIQQSIVNCDFSVNQYTVKTGMVVELASREAYDPDASFYFVVPQKEAKRRKVQGQAFLDFPVARSVILPTYRRNSEELGKILNAINKVREDKEVVVDKIYIEGYASPEGRYDVNERLSRERAIALVEYIKSQTHIPGDLFQVSSVAEDWDGLRALVESSSMSYKSMLLDLLDSSVSTERKKSVMKVMGGGSYNILLTEIFPQLR